MLLDIDVAVSLLNTCIFQENLVTVKEEDEDEEESEEEVKVNDARHRSGKKNQKESVKKENVSPMKIKKESVVKDEPKSKNSAKKDTAKHTQDKSEKKTSKRMKIDHDEQVS